MSQDSLQKDLLSYLGAKELPNAHEVFLFEKTKKYMEYIRWIPGIRMIAVCNSLAFYATHDNSDIDLFVITEKNRLWIVRICITTVFFILGVWRHGRDIRENFCLSFFITEDAMNLTDIAIENDIYLAGWMKSLKPIMDANHTYEHFIEVNSWVTVTEEEKRKNSSYTSIEKNNIHDTNILLNLLERMLRGILLPKTLKNYEAKGKPWGVIITESILKFHDQDKRREIRDRILEKNFDK